jgi:hypothetical protein
MEEETLPQLILLLRELRAAEKAVEQRVSDSNLTVRFR